MARLPLNDCPRTTVFDAVCDILTGDPTLSTLGIRWQTYRGEPVDKVRPADSSAPFVRLVMGGGALEWWSPSGLKEPLNIAVDIDVAGYDSRDLANLWYAMVRAFYPPDDPAADPPNAPTLAVQARLRAAGAETGLVDFTTLFQGPDRDELGKGRIVAAGGQIAVEVLNDISA